MLCSRSPTDMATQGCHVMGGVQLTFEPNPVELICCAVDALQTWQPRVAMS